MIIQVNSMNGRSNGSLSRFARLDLMPSIWIFLWSSARKTLEELLEKYRLGLGLQGPFIHTPEELERCLDTVQRMQAPYLDAQIGDYFIPEAEARELLRKIVNLSVHRKVHCCADPSGTGDSGFVSHDWTLSSSSDLSLNLDLSHISSLAS